MSNLIPSKLKLGDTIAIVSTARKISEEELKPAISMIERLGFKVKLGMHLFNIDRQFAGTDKERAQDLQDSFEDSSVSAILCARGGYGTIRLLPFLDFDKIKSNPKWLIGYSDVTVLHALLNQKLSMASLHASMPINFPSYKITDQTISSLFNAIQGKPLEYQIDAHSMNRLGTAEGILLGGNLSMLYSIRGTEIDLDTDGKILFIEDLDEYLYHIDRMMMNLKIGGKLAKLKALIVGGMSDMNDNTVPFGKTAKEIVWEAVKDYDYPVVFDFAAGHIHENYALPMGQTIRIESSKEKVSFTLF
jgi:muramoyltetrapeptide carboxypeptidase